MAKKKLRKYISKLMWNRSVFYNDELKYKFPHSTILQLVNSNNKFHIRLRITKFPRINTKIMCKQTVYVNSLFNNINENTMYTIMYGLIIYKCYVVSCRYVS